jgi:hypothetical protein
LELVPPIDGAETSHAEKEKRGFDFGWRFETPEGIALGHSAMYLDG